MPYKNKEDAADQKKDGDYLILKKYLNIKEDTGRITHTNMLTKEQKNSIK